MILSFLFLSDQAENKTLLMQKINAVIKPG